MPGEFQAFTIEDLEASTYGPIGLVKADDPVLTTTANVYNAIFGAKVWVQLNLEANVFGFHPKTPWGTHSGVRVLTARSYSTLADVANPPENGTLPESRKPSLLSYTQKPIPVVDTFDVSETQQFLGGVDDSLGDTMGVYRDWFGKEHVERINRQLVVRQKDYSATPNFITSLDRIISGFPERSAVDTTIASGAVDVFGLDRTSAASQLDSYVDNNSAGGYAARAYSNSLLDSAFTALLKRGAKPKVILTGYNTWQKMKAEVTGIGTGTSGYPLRWVDPNAVKELQPSVNGIRSAMPGTEGAIQVATYNGVPILQSKDVLAPIGVTEADPIYIEDTDYIHMRIAKPTQYFENGILSGDPFVVNRLGQKGMYRTLMESWCNGFVFQGKITHLSA